ncbi:MULTISPECIES: hypothetical protein [Paenibacillus]|uniref:hypothetical protein n=1 Tax=Paenibacillus TaxID=44249 RepID=UPI000B840E39|nr:hypothetical protein [Paenibacillus amylolyticus]
MKTYVKLYQDYDQSRILYVGEEENYARNITMQQVEGDEYVNYGGATHELQIWENGVLVHTEVEIKKHYEDFTEDSRNYESEPEDRYDIRY